MNNGSLPPGILTSGPKRRVDHTLGASVTTHLLMPEDNLRIDEDTGSKFDGINEFLALWSHELIRSTILLWLVNFACYFAYYGIVLLISEVSNGKRSCASVGPHLMQPKDSSLYINVLVTSFAEFPGLLVAALLIDKVGRRVSMGGLILLCCAFVVPLAINLRGTLAPQPGESSFDAWWERASAATTGLIRKGLNSLIVLGAWTIWKHRNRCVFDGATPNIAEVMILVGEERRLWSLAGARGLSYLTAPPPVD